MCQNEWEFKSVNIEIKVFWKRISKENSNINRNGFVCASCSSVKHNIYLFIFIKYLQKLDLFSIPFKNAFFAAIEVSWRASASAVAVAAATAAVDRRSDFFPIFCWYIWNKKREKNKKTAKNQMQLNNNWACNRCVARAFIFCHGIPCKWQNFYYHYSLNDKTWRISVLLDSRFYAKTKSHKEIFFNFNFIEFVESVCILCALQIDVCECIFSLKKKVVERLWPFLQPVDIVFDREVFCTIACRLDHMKIFILKYKFLVIHFAHLLVTGW